MGDPAVDAARRAWDRNKVQSFHVQRVTAANEALAPIRELHAEWEAYGFLPPEAWQILDALAELIYAPEERP